MISLRKRSYDFGYIFFDLFLFILILIFLNIIEEFDFYDGRKVDLVISEYVINYFLMFLLSVVEEDFLDINNGYRDRVVIITICESSFEVGVRSS